MRFRYKLLLCLGFLLTLSLLPSAASAQQTITCESNNGNRKYCGHANPGQVSMQRQLSQSSCVEGQSWGVDNQGLWVDRGCRAEFRIGGWNNGGNNGGGWNGGGNGNQITCESNNGSRKYCGNANGQVNMQRQLSQAPCVQGQSWGVDRQGLWVDRGCRAVFTANGWNGGNNGGNWNGGGWNGGNMPSVSNYPRVKVDTSGRGNFNSQNFGTANITRGWVDTRSGQPQISLSGSGGFKITFFGNITQADKRHMTMQINNSSRGSTFGQADIYLNGDKNEVESISVNGRNFNGNFSRK